jgi:hypothetical protein
MIPALNQSGVLPPFLPNAGPVLAAMAPYQANLTELVIRFASTPERVEIIRGLLDYRKLLLDAGITDGFQWIDGSYVESCEHHRGRPPSDIDIVTFAERPAKCVDDTLWGTFVQQNKTGLFDRGSIKRQYRCDAFYEDLSLPSRVIVSRATYWFGLFSHQRTTYLWKGLLVIPLQADDQAALALLNGGINHAS